MIILEIVEKLTEENTYFSAYIAGLSTRDRSRRCLLNVQTQVCAASGSKRGEVHEHIFLLYFFTTRRDGPVWKSQGLSSVPGRSRCSPKCRHWTSCERWDSFWVSGELCYQVLPPHPHPHPAPLSHYHSRCIPCSCCLGIRLVSAGWQPFFYLFLTFST